jgi:hypothetical protein
MSLDCLLNRFDVSCISHCKIDGDCERKTDNFLGKKLNYD